MAKTSNKNNEEKPKANEEKLKRFISKIKKKFKMYFVAYGLRKHNDNYFINIIIDDRDVMSMEKEDLRKRIDDIFKPFLKSSQEEIKAKTIFVSDLNELNIWDYLEKEAVIFDVKAATSFAKIKIPQDFLKAYKELPSKFKLSDFIREMNKTSKRAYHRNTYQNWLKSLKTAGFLKLKDKTYSKIEEPYKKKLLENYSE